MGNSCVHLSSNLTHYNVDRTYGVGAPELVGIEEMVERTHMLVTNNIRVEWIEAGYGFYPNSLLLYRVVIIEEFIFRIPTVIK